MTENTAPPPVRYYAVPPDTLDRTMVRFRLQDNDYRPAVELTMPRADWEDLGSPGRLYLTASTEVPQLGPTEHLTVGDPELHEEDEL